MEKGDVYTYKGIRYVFSKSVALKHPINRLWVNAVLYYPEGKPDSPCVRVLAEFIKKFVKIQKL